MLPLFLEIKQTEQCYFICIKFKIHFLESSLQIYNFENEVQAITFLSGKLIPVYLGVPDHAQKMSIFEVIF